MYVCVCVCARVRMCECMHVFMNENVAKLRSK